VRWRLSLCVSLALTLAAIARVAAQELSRQDALLARLAIDLAAERGPSPISIDPDGSARHGLIYERFVHAQLAARAARRRGTPLDPLKPPSTLLNKWLVVVPVPLVCDGSPVRPTDVDLVGSNGRPVQKFAALRGTATESVLTGVTIPAGAIAVAFADTVLRPDETVRVSYTGPACPDSEPRAFFPVTMSSIRPQVRPAIEVLPGQERPDVLTLTIAGVVDLDGRLRYATAPEAATPLGATALKIALTMPFAPARINGSPVPWTSGVILDFRVQTAASAPAR
jgi:hypothetical protein